MTQTVKMDPETFTRCPFLGISDDPETSIGYPSEWNVCHKAHGHPSPTFLHQSEFCLSAKHPECELYRADKNTWMPAELKNSDGAVKPVDPAQKQIWRISAVIASILLLAVIFWFMFTQEINTLVTDLSQPTSTITAVPTFTSTPQLETPTAPGFGPTITPYPTLTRFTYTPCGHPLDQEFGTGQTFLIHQISEGESIDSLIQPLGITYKQIQQVNYFVPQPLWIGFPLIIPSKANDFSASQTYQALELGVENKTLEELAAQLDVDPQTFSELNGIPQGCNSFSGWFILPREGVKYYE